VNLKHLAHWLASFSRFGFSRGKIDQPKNTDFF